MSTPERLATAATAVLGIEHPVVLAPMGAVSGGALAAAVSEAGGLRLIGVGYGEPSWLVREFGNAGTSRVGCGFITWLLARRPAMLDLALDRDPAAIMLSFGDVGPFADRIRAAGVPLIAQVSSAAEAGRALDVGVDVVVAQGGEGGGHGTHDRSTMTLVPEVCDLVAQRGLTIPVLAAGGIADGRGLAAVLMLGADGALVGTRLWASSEALVSPVAQQRTAQATGDDTIATTVYDRVRGITWPPGFTSRVLRSPFVSTWHGREAELGWDLDAAAARYRRATADDDFDVAAITVGEAAGLVHGAEPAAAIVASMVAGAAAALRGHRPVHP